MRFIGRVINPSRLERPDGRDGQEGDQNMLNANTLKRVLRWLGMLFGPGGGTLDPFANRPVPVAPRPKGKSGAVALAEPDDD
jgi:hypothetical protein